MVTSSLKKKILFYPRIAATVRNVLLVKQFGSNRARYASSSISIHNCTFVSVRDVSFKVAGLWGQVPVDQILTGLLMGFEPPGAPSPGDPFYFISCHLFDSRFETGWWWRLNFNELVWQLFVQPFSAELSAKVEEISVKRILEFKTTRSRPQTWRSIVNLSNPPSFFMLYMKKKENPLL